MEFAKMKPKKRAKIEARKEAKRQKFENLVKYRIVVPANQYKELRGQLSE